MARDSLFSEKVLWSAGPQATEASSLQRLSVWVLATTALVSTLLAVAAGSAGIPPGGLLIFAAWCATFALLVRAVPLIWAQGVRFVITDRHVIWSRGKIKRSMQRDGISYARIHWSRRHPGFGDLELVRAVPTGALRRRLTLALAGVAEPDKVWAIVRRGEPTATHASWRDPIRERLDTGERIVWFEQLRPTWRSWLPMTTRRTFMTALGLLCLTGAVRTGSATWSMPERLRAGGVDLVALPSLSLIGAVVLTILLLGGMGALFLYLGVVQKPLLDRKTRYFVTDQRVLLQRDCREIHLDRKTLVDLIDTDGLYGGRDVYLVLDGPDSRAYAAQGAFGRSEGARGFLPVMRSVRDVVGLRRALLD